MKAEDVISSEEFQRCADFHGHVCPGLAIGFQAARLLLERLGITRAKDEELLAVVETDACGADAIQVMTGCTFGKGNFVHRNYGKHAFSLGSRNLGKMIRASLRPGAFPPDPEHLLLFERIRREKASPEEAARFKQTHQEKTRKILQALPESIFRVEEIAMDFPPKARIMESETCHLCGEPTKIDLLTEIKGKKFCIPCAKEV
jgi:formylmethanofuran dehydrogenase subunit E